MTTSPLFPVAFFNNKSDSKPKPQGKTWAEFVQMFKRPAIRADKDGPLFSPARFKNGHRLNGNVLSLSMLVLDFDHDITLTEALDICEEMGVNFSLHSSHSHQRITDKHPAPEDCFRVIIPLKDPIPAEDFPTLWEWGNRQFRSKADPQRRDLCGMFYLPAIYSADSPYEIFSKTDGDFLDWRDLKLGGDSRTNVGGCSAPLRFAPPPHTPQTNAAERDVCVSSHSSSTESNKERASSSPALVCSAGVSLTDITYDSSDEFEAWKAGLIAHISKHHLAKLNRSGRLDVPGLCHGSDAGTAVFCDPRINAVTCNKGCAITQVAKSFDYATPKIKKNQTGVKDVNNENSKTKEESPKVDQAETPSTSIIRAKRLSDIEIKPVNWLVKNLIPKGMLTLATGIEAVGKTTVLCSIAASVTKEGGNVLWLAAEDSPEQVLKPRLVTAGADESKVVIVGEAFTIAGANAGGLKDLIKKERPSLVVVDPVTAYLNGDPNKPNVVRSLTNFLKKLAEEFDCAIVLVRHVGKSKGMGEPRAAGLYSIEWRAAVRSEILFGSDPEDSQKKALVQTKPSLIPEGKCESVGYEIKDSDGVAVCVWTGQSSLTAERILSQVPTDEERTEKAAAVSFLRAILKDGEVAALNIKTAAAEEGLSTKQLEKARARLGIMGDCIRHEGQGKNRVTYWRLPPDSNNPVSASLSFPPEDSSFPPHTDRGGSSEVIDLKASYANNFPAFPPTTTMGKAETDTAPDSNNPPDETDEAILDMVWDINAPSVLAAKESFKETGRVEPDQMANIRANIPVWKSQRLLRNGNGAATR